MKIMQAMLVIKFNKGFTYVGLLLFIAITGIGLSVAGMSWQYQVRAEKEKQLLFVGAEFRNAINNYYSSTTDTVKVYPASLDDLLLDKRMPTIKRHLRKIYTDPMTGKADWGFETKEGRIVGIYSRSSLVPYKKKGFNVADAKFAGAKSYMDWIFGSLGNTKQKTLDNSSGLSNSVAKSPTINSENEVNQVVVGNQNGSSNKETNVSPKGNTPSDHLNKLEYFKKFGVVPD
jgi:type II secretory pathway pseudopilin PulG